jgi:hypothetical protein
MLEINKEKACGHEEWGVKNPRSFVMKKCASNFNTVQLFLSIRVIKLCTLKAQYLCRSDNGPTLHISTEFP